MSVRRTRHRDAFHDLDNVESLAELDERPSKLRGDERNVAILFFLYLLQGIPLGLMQAIPIILANSGVNYTQQAQFSLVNWPFSLKLLWAPIVDSLYWTRMGKRKSWLIPIQYLIGFLMLFLSTAVDGMLEGDEPNMFSLVCVFFVLNFLAATQDIAVDGWALTMLRRENVAYASTCNSVGQTAGYMFGYVAFIALESASFCNAYLRETPEAKGIVTLSGFLYFWGLVFLITTTLVWLLKSERGTPNTGTSMSVLESYKTLWRIIRLKPIQLLAIILLTAKVAFSAFDALTGLKLIEAGVPKEKLALLAIPLVPVQIVLPLLLSKWTSGANPMNIYLKAYPYRIGFGIFMAAFVWITPVFIHNGEVPYYYYVLLLVFYGFYDVALYSMFVSQMSFFAKISDPAVGGTYMTLINTLANMGSNWPTTAALCLVDGFTTKQCTMDVTNYCGDPAAVKACGYSAGVCETQVDGYYIEVLCCSVIGVFWLLCWRGTVRRLQSYPLQAYAVSTRHR